MGGPLYRQSRRAGNSDANLVRLKIGEALHLAAIEEAIDKEIG